MSWEIVALVSVLVVTGACLLVIHWGREDARIEYKDFGPDILVLRKSVGDLSADVASLKKAQSESQLARAMKRG